MTVGSIGKQFSYEKPYNNQKVSGRKYDGFLNCIGEKADAKTGDAAKTNSCSRSATAVNYRESRMITEISIMESGHVDIKSLMECSVKNLSYAECDNVKICVMEGYTLKAKVDVSAHQVYIEQKNEDGIVHAYEVNPFMIDKNTRNPVERMALESWEMARNELNRDGIFEEIGVEEESLTHEKALLAFYDFIEDRIKNGPPKIATGGAEFSVKEWNNLIEEFDRYLEEVRAELRARLEKLQRESREEDEDALDVPLDGEDLEKKIAELFEDKDSADSQIIVKPDGSRVLLINLKIGGMESVMSLEISKPTKTSAEGGEESVESTQHVPRGKSFLDSLDDSKKKAPYSYLADDNHTITYKGVTFYCDNEKESLCLGDTSDVDNTLVIPLSEGGCLKVNRDNLGDLARAIGMFGPEDQGRIMRAISLDAKVRQTKIQIDEETSGMDIGDNGKIT